MNQHKVKLTPNLMRSMLRIKQIVETSWNRTESVEQLITRKYFSRGKRID